MTETSNAKKGTGRIPTGSLPQWPLIQSLRAEKPLIHCITNYVTVNDVANVILAAGASPIMADAGSEVEEITSLSKGLVLNIGTLQEASVEGMLAAGRKAAELGHPIVVDPVGIGASALRWKTAFKLIEELPCTVIRGNASEIRILAGQSAHSQGVDADVREQVEASNQMEAVAMMQALSSQTGAVIVMTGAVDVVADAAHSCLIKNGHPMMASITGTGCMLNGILAAFQTADVSVNSGAAQKEQNAEADGKTSKKAANEAGMSDTATENIFWRAVYAVAAAGLCGESAYEKMQQADGGTGSFRMYFIDAVSRLTDEAIWKGAKIEV